MTKYKPLNNFILVKKQNTNILSSGFIIKNSGSLTLGTIVDISDNLKQTSLKINDKIIFSNLSSHSIEFDNEEFCFIEYKYILGKKN